jgi:excisionase family DNA binding protein
MVYNEIRQKDENMNALLEKPFTAGEATEYLGIARSTLYNLVCAGKITCYKPSGKLLYFRRKDLDAFAFQNKKVSDFQRNEQAENILNGVKP